jgi:hypothetical protein
VGRTAFRCESSNGRAQKDGVRRSTDRKGSLDGCFFGGVRASKDEHNCTDARALMRWHEGSNWKDSTDEGVGWATDWRFAGWLVMRRNT